MVIGGVVSLILGALLIKFADYPGIYLTFLTEKIKFKKEDRTIGTFFTEMMNNYVLMIIIGVALCVTGLILLYRVSII